MLDDSAVKLVLATRVPHVALAVLVARDRQHVFLEGGPTLAAVFLLAGLVDEVVAYVAPMLLGAGRSAVADLGVATIADAWRLDLVDVTVLDPLPDPDRDTDTDTDEREPANLRLTLTVHPRETGR